MGDIEDGIVEGLFCQGCCGVIDGDAPGYPRDCSDCGPSEDGVAVPEIHLGRKLIHRLRLIEGMTDRPAGMYPGDYWSTAGAQHAKLERHGLVEKDQPHNRVHHARVVITDTGRAWLAR